MRAEIQGAVACSDSSVTVFLCSRNLAERGRYLVSLSLGPARVARPASGMFEARD